MWITYFSRVQVGYFSRFFLTILIPTTLNREGNEKNSKLLFWYFPLSVRDLYICAYLKLIWGYFSTNST